MATPHEFYLSVINKGFDTDGYGYQCVAGFKVFCKQVLGLNFYHKSICYGGNPSGYAYRIWYNFDSLGLGKYFEKVAPNKMVDGDWAIWNWGSRPCPYSHIAMFRKDNGNGTGIFLGQNQSVNGARFSQVNISYSGLLGALRPKIYHQNKPKPQPSDTRNFVNLPPSISSWRFYNINSKPIKKNAIGTLNPKKFRGLSYYVYRYLDNGTTAEIQTVQFGRVKIYIKDTPASITIGYYKYKQGNH